MAEYIKREDILNYANSIRPTDEEYANAYKSEEMALTALDRVAHEPEKLPYEEINKEVWHDASKELPMSFVSVIGHMTDADLFPECRECYVVKDKFFFPALDESHPVDYWMYFPLPTN